MTTRQPPFDREVPEGFHLVAVPEGDDWRIEDGSAHCRRAFGGSRKGAGGVCRKPAVLALRRTPRYPGPWGKVVPQWWRYCAEHAYGRWVEDGRVWVWILRADDDELETRQ